MSRVREHLSPALVLALIALFVSIGGVAAAVKKAPKNSVVKKSIKANAVTGVKIADGQVGTADLADQSVTATKIAPGAVPQTTIQPGSITGAMIKDGSVGEADVAASLLGDRSFGRSAVQPGQCGGPGVPLPPTPPFPECVALTDMDLPRDGRVLLVADGLLAFFGDALTPVSLSAACQITIDGTPTVSGADVTMWADGPFQEEGISLTQVTDPLTAGEHDFAVICSAPVLGVIASDFHLSAVSLSAD